MKKILYKTLFLALLISACSEEFSIEDQGIELQEFGNYVAFSVNGVGTSISDIDISEGAGNTGSDINIEIPGGTVSDVTVNYEFSGTAVFGTDFNIAGASANGGSVVIETQSTPIVDGLPLNVDIPVIALTDGVVDGEKTLNINLVSASNAEGEILVGRGGTDFLKTVTVNFQDSDYVAFASSSLSVEEGQEDVSVTLEAYPGNERDTDVTVTYTLGGTAVFGTDYTIAGATATGGTATIIPNVEGDGDPSTLDLDIVILDNTDVAGEDDEAKTIEITLTGASDNKEDELTLGVGGDDDLTVTTITINDNDTDYVSFASTSESKSVAENDGSVSLTLEAYPGANRETVTVNYTVTGSAILGEDYTIVGASTTDDVTTGSIVITPNVGGTLEPSTVTFQVVLLTDDTKDGEKTIIITLDDASEPSTAEIPVGVDGTDMLKTATITIADID